MNIKETEIGMAVTHETYGKGQVLSINKFFGYVKVLFGDKTKRVRPVSLTAFKEKEEEKKEETLASIEETIIEESPEIEKVVEEITAEENIGEEEPIQTSEEKEDEDYIIPIKLNRISFEEIKEKIKKLIAQETWNYGTSTISAILLGVKSKVILSRGLDSNPLFGVFANKDVTEVEINIGVDELLHDKESSVIRDRDSGVITLKEKKTKKQMVKETKEEMFADVLAKENPMLLKWFDVASKIANPKARKVSTKNYYGYKTKKGKYWITKGKTNKDLVFRYRIGEDGEIQTALLNERTKSYIGHLIVVLAK